MPPNFFENREKGENDSYICKLIREDSIDEFIEYVNKSNISLESTINQSIYETNAFLIQKQNEYIILRFNQSNSNSSITLMEYAAFFGSIQIFQYLKINGVEMNQELWLYSIHGKNAEIIHLIEERHIEPTIADVNSYKECFIESISAN